MRGSKGTIIFISIFILIGVALLYFGVNNTYKSMLKTKDYISIKGTFTNSHVYASDDDGTTYTLTYSYTVNGKEYTISTDYGTGVVPKYGTIKTIKYNPHNPSEAIISGFGSNSLLLVIGFMFTVIPIIMLMASFKKKDNSKKNNNFKEKAAAIFMGFVFVIMGIFTYYIMCSGGDSLSVIVAFQSAGLWALVPILFIVAGIYVVFTSIFSPKHKKLISNYDESKAEEVLLNVQSKIAVGLGIFVPIYQVIVSSIFTAVCLWVFIAGIDSVTKIVITPFLICGIAILVRSIIGLIKVIVESKRAKSEQEVESNDQLVIQQQQIENIEDKLNVVQNITSKIYTIGFLLFWFGFLIIFDYTAIKQINEGGLQMLLFSLIFWAAGIFVTYKNFKR